MKNTYFKSIVIALVTCFALHLNAQNNIISKKLKWSERMALTIMSQHKESYMIDNATSPKWDYVHGLVLTSFEELNKQFPKKIYQDYIRSYVNNLVQNDGSIATYKIDSYNIDMIVAGRLLFNLYESTKENKYLIALQTLKKQIEEQPRTISGGFWHKKIYPNQMWLDGLYMGEPFYAQYTKTFENGKNFEDIAKQFELIERYDKDPKTKLLYHAWDESKQMPWANKITGTSPNFWSRSLGWYAMALVDVLDFFPKDHPNYNQLVEQLNDLAAALIPFQHKTGLWYQVTDKGELKGNYLEGSGSAMFVYALAKGVNKGYLPKKYKKVALKGFDGITKKLIKTNDKGEIIITQVCAVAGLGGNPYRDGSYEYYINEKKKDNDPKATGPFILAALELNK